MQTIFTKIIRKLPRSGDAPRSKEPEPNPTDAGKDESPKLNLDRETIQLLKDDKIATGG